MIRGLWIRGVGKDPTGIFHNRFGIDRGSDRSARIQLAHNLVSVTVQILRIVVDQPVFGHGSIGKVINFGTFTTLK